MGQPVGYNTPVNAKNLGEVYLYLGLLNQEKARIKTVQGLTANGRAINFRNCDGNPNSYFTVFPNFAEKETSDYGRKRFTGIGKVGYQLLRARTNNPSGRLMPPDYFTMGEYHFGGCGGYGITDSRVLGVNLGFR